MLGDAGVESSTTFELGPHHPLAPKGGMGSIV